jgi:hypothetical protein
MAVEIHPLMQNANDIDARSALPVEHHVRTGGVLGVACSDIVTTPAAARVGGDCLDSGLNLAQVDLGLAVAPTGG